MYNSAFPGVCCYVYPSSADWKQRDTIFDQRRGWLKQKPFLQKAAGNLFSSTGSLFVCLRLFRAEWLHLFVAASIATLCVYLHRASHGANSGMLLVFLKITVSMALVQYALVALFKYRHQLLNASTWALRNRQMPAWGQQKQEWVISRKTVDYNLGMDHF